MENKDLEPELVCFDDIENKSEGYGGITEGMLFRCSCSLARRLQQSSNAVLTTLGKHFAFEISIGANGYFILDANKPSDVISLANVILESEYQPEGDDIRWLYERINTIVRSR